MSELVCTILLPKQEVAAAKKYIVAQEALYLRVEEVTRDKGDCAGKSDDRIDTLAEAQLSTLASERVA